MRKHFLILMLLTLLPMATWALPANLKVGSDEVYAIKATANGELVYNKTDYAGTAWTIQYQLVENGVWQTLPVGSYSIQYYDAENTDQVDHAVNADDYYIGLTGTSESVTGVLAADKRFKFTVAKAALNITVADGRQAYGDGAPAWSWEINESESQLAPGDSKMTLHLIFTPVLEEGDPGIQHAGTHNFVSVTATELNKNYDVTVANSTSIKLIVDPATITVKVGPAFADATELNPYLFQRDYYQLDGEALTISSEKVSFVGKRGDDDVDLKYTVAGKVSYTYTNANVRTADANADLDGALLSEEEHANDAYKVRFSGVELTGDAKDDYVLEFEERIARVKQIEIVAAGVGSPFTYTAGEEETLDFTYTGEAQEPVSHAITYQWGENEEEDVITLTKGVDYDFAYSNGYEGEDTPVSAGNYAVKVVTAAGEGAKHNFVVATEGGIGVASFGFTIAPKELTIAFNRKTKEYDGVAPSLDGGVTYADFTFDGWVTADASKAITLTTWEFAGETAAFAKNAGKYYVKAKVTDDSKIGTDKIRKNYLPNCLEIGYYEVTKKALTVEVIADKTITYGDDLPATKALSDAGYAALVTVTGALVNPTLEINETAAVKAALSLGLKEYKIPNPENPEEQIVDAHHYDNAGTYTGDWAISYAVDGDGNPTNATLANYAITVTNKNFIKSNAGFKMMAIATSKKYDGTAATDANFDYVAYDGAEIIGIADNVTVTYEVLNPETEKWQAVTSDFPKNVGTYTYRVKDNTAYAPANYDGKKIQYPTATFTIEPKLIDVTINELDLHVGDDVDILNKYAIAVVDEETPLVGKEKVDFVFNFVDDESVTTHIDENGKLINPTVEGIEEAINVALADFVEGKNNNNNYEIRTVNLGTLNIVPGVISTFDVADAGYVDQLEQATADTDADHKIDVRFKNTLYTLPAGQWSTLVLPFDITPLEFCNMTGIKQYAIFNKLTSANASTNVVRFSLEQEKLPANTPFLVKAPQEIVLDEVEFTDRNIEYDETPTATVSQAMFIGSYVDVENIEGGANKMWWDKKAGNFVKATDGGVAKAFPNYCFHAYLVLDSSFSADANVRILVEEADGTVTAISNINAEGVAVPAEGWYTINGVKLQGAPTQKGIYINNGKKIVVK